MLAKIRMVAMKRDMQAENEQPRSRVLSHVRNYSEVSIDGLLGNNSTHVYMRSCQGLLNDMHHCVWWYDSQDTDGGHEKRHAGRE